MRIERCPKCNAKVGPTDTQCLDCGEDLLKHLEELRKAATQKRLLTKEERVERAQRAAQAAARGRAFGVDRSEETRLRTFDKHEAENVKGEIVTAWVTAAIALIIGLIAMKVGADQLKAAGGSDGLRELSMAQLRDWGFGMAAQASVLAVIATGMAVGALLCAAGQAWRAIIAHRSVAAVARGEKPAVVYIHPATRSGLIVISVVCPPFGVVFGLLMKVGGRDEDTKAVGGSMLIAAVIVIVVLGINMLWGLAANLKAPEQSPGSEDADDTSAMIRQALALARMMC